MSLMPKGLMKGAPNGAQVSVRNKTVAMVEGHLNKQRSAYDHWIAELCRDAEESAMERDRLKGKLAALRDDHKRKVMTKIIGRLGNMNYFVAWNHWHTVTIKDAQKRAGERIRELKKQLKECKKKTEELEAEAQRRADEASALAFGAATDSQKKLIWKILTRLSTLKMRLFWGHWYKQAFGAKLQKLLMIKIMKRMMNSFLNKGFGMWKHVTQNWALLKKLELKDQLVKELEELERLAKQYKEDAEKRQEEASNAAFSRISGEKKDFLVRILSKMTGNQTVLVFKVWKRKSDDFEKQYQLLKKTFNKMINIKKYTAFRHWHNVVFLSGLSKVKMREALLESQRENLSSTLAERAEELRKLQQEASDLLALSQQNAQRTAEVMACSDHFADALHLILDPKALEKRNALSYEDMEAMMASGADPAQFQKPPYDPVPPPNPYDGYGAAPSPQGPAGVGGLGFLDAPVAGAGARGAPARKAAGAAGGGGADLEGYKPLPPGDYYYRPTSP